MTRVIVCGRRTYGSIPPWTPVDQIDAANERAKAERALLERALDDLHRRHRFTCVIQRGGNGAAENAKRWATKEGIAWRTILPVRADGGYIDAAKSNQKMIDEGKPDLVIAFPGGDGTKDMKQRARRAGLKVIRPANEMVD